MKGRKLISQGSSDLEIAKKLGVELEDWLECRHICSGPPVQLNDAVHDVSSSGYHGKPQLIEDDRTELYMNAVKIAWESAPKLASALFWNVNGKIGNSEQRIELLNVLFERADMVLNGTELPSVETHPIDFVTIGDQPPDAELNFTEEELGDGRYQTSLF